MSAHEQLKARVDLMERVQADHAYILKRQIIGNKNADQAFAAIYEQVKALEARIAALEPQQVADERAVPV